MALFLNKMHEWYLLFSSKDMWSVFGFLVLLYTNSANCMSLTQSFTLNWQKPINMSLLCCFISLSGYLSEDKKQWKVFA